MEPTSADAGAAKSFCLSARTPLWRGPVVTITKLQDALNQQHFAKDIKVTLSFGVAASNDDKDAEHQLRRANDALYETERRGRDCYVVADRFGTEGLTGDSGIADCSVRKPPSPFTVPIHQTAINPPSLCQ